MTADDRDKEVPLRRRRALGLIVRSAFGILLAALLGTLMVSCAIRPPDLNSIDGVDRLSALDASWPGLESEVAVEWDAHLIPSIHASSDHDAAYALGVLHAHLRLAQMELFRRVSQGRLSEMVGPIAADVDEAIRALDLDRAVGEMERMLPAATRDWIEAYVEGVNEYRVRVRRRPADARTLGLRYSEPWSVRDVLTFGRLASADVNWGRWITLAGLKDQEGYDDFVARLWRFGDAGVPSFGGEMRHDLNVITDFGRSGSNALVVSGDRSVSGGALVASDPHLGLPQPNIWCVVGYRTPDRAVVGLTIPGIPFVLVGRNERIAWTGTNMQGSSSALYQLDDGWSEKQSRSEKIKVRFWFDRRRAIRESVHGPVLTDAKLLRGLGEGDIAFRWRGHDPSDESSAFHRTGSAQSWDEFREAFSTYATGGQNMLYGDADGNIGQIIAIEAIPAAAAASRLGVVDPADERFVWGPGTPSDELPAAFNPDSGFLASANNVPTRMSPALVPQGNANDRMLRMRELLSEDRTYSLEDLAVIQRDTFSGASRRAAQRFAEILEETSDTEESLQSIRAALESWDGRYEIDSEGAVAYQVMLSELLELLYADRYGPKIRGTLRNAPYVHDFVLEDIADREAEAPVIESARRASPGVAEIGTWGSLHRLELAHPIGAAPLIGSAYVFESYPHPGSTTTIYKSAHRISGTRHSTTFGACARVLFDMGTLDDNRVVLLGGQDGWLGSDRLLDQVPIWRSNDYIELPLTVEAQRAQSVRTTRLLP